MEVIYDAFENLCLTANINDIESYIIKLGIDVNYDDGYFMELIGQRNNTDLLKIFIKHGGNIHINNEGLLRLVCHEGYMDLVKFLITECNADYKVVYESTAYCNKSYVKEYIDSLSK